MFLGFYKTFEWAFDEFKIVYKNRDVYLPSDTEIKEEIEKLSKKRIQILTIDSVNYPVNLRKQKGAPLVLYAKGDIGIINKKPCVAVSGSRKPTVETLKSVKEVISTISKKYNIVSGLALGVDTIAHKNSLENGTIAFVGHGLDYCYPKENKRLMEKIISKNGCVLSEFECNISPKPENFPKRNMLIVSSSEALLAFQIENKSGTFITVKIAQRQGKKILIPNFKTEFSGEAPLLKSKAIEKIDEGNILSQIENSKKESLF